MQTNPLYIFILGVCLGVIVTIFIQRALAQIKKTFKKKFKLNRRRKAGPKRRIFLKGPAPKNIKTIGNLRLAVQKDDSMYGYTRDMFGPALSTLVSGDNGITPRDRILMRDGKNVRRAGTKIISGIWICPYTGVRMTSPSEVEIDHIVPLSEAWKSGAQTWPPNKLLLFGRTESNLVAVSKAANREKSGNDITHWLPIYNTAEYIESWLQIKAYFELTMDESEYALIDQLLS